MWRPTRDQTSLHPRADREWSQVASREFVGLDLRADSRVIVVVAEWLAMAVAWQPLVAAELLAAPVSPPRVLLQQFFLAALCQAVLLVAWSPQAASHRWVSHPRVSLVAFHQSVLHPLVSPHLALIHWVFHPLAWNLVAASSAALAELCHLWSRPLFQQAIFVFQFCVHPQVEQPRMDSRL